MTIYCEPGAPALAADGAPAGRVHAVDGVGAADAALAADPQARLVVIGSGIALAEALAFAARQRILRPTLGVVLLRAHVAVDVLAEAIRAGVREVVPDGDPPALRLACERSLEVSRQLGAAAPAGAADAARAPQGRIVTVFAGKGGCGKSTVATNLAVTLAAGGRNRVLLVDLDLQFGDVGIMLQLTPERNIADAIAMAGRLDADGLRSLLTKYRPGVDTLLAPAGPAEGDHVGRDLITELLGVAREVFDFIVVDTPPFFSDQVLAALDVTDRFVLVVTPDLPTLKSVRLTLEMFELLGYPAQRRIALLNRADSQVGLSVSDIEKAVSVPMSVLMPSSRDVPVSVNRGVPLAVDKPGHPVSRAVRDLAERCAGGALAGAAAPKSGWRVFGRRG